MSDKPILFSGSMVRAILEGRKTMTRRLVKPQSLVKDNGRFSLDGMTSSMIRRANHQRPEFINLLWCSPYRVGDILYVRETWAETINVNETSPWPDRPCTNYDPGPYASCVIYRADGEWEWCDDDGFATEKSYWKPSIHMPRKYSRITLEVTAVRVERLQEITPEDCEAEGVTGKTLASPVRGLPYDEYSIDNGLTYPDPITAFTQLWDSINGKKYPWKDNPFVWVIEFRRLAPNEREEG